MAQPLQQALGDPAVDGGLGHGGRVARVRVAGQQEVDRAALAVQAAGGVDEFGQALVPQQPRGEEHAEGWGVGVGGVAPTYGFTRREAHAIHPRTGDQADLPRRHQPRLFEHRHVIGVLQDQPRIAAIERGAHQQPHQRPQRARLRIGAGEHVTHPGHRVDPRRHPGRPRGQRAVHRALDGEAVDQLRALAPEQPPQVHQHRRLAQRIEAAPVHRHRFPAQAQRAQPGPVLARRRQQQQLMPGFAQRQRQRAAEVVQIPVGIGEQDDLAH